VVGNCVLLADEMRNRGGMVIFVRVLVGELLALPADNPNKKPEMPPEAIHLAPDAQVQASDIVVTKRQWGAFYGTDLEQILRRRGIKTIVHGRHRHQLRRRIDRARGLRPGLRTGVRGRCDEQRNRAKPMRSRARTLFKTMGRVRTTRELIDAFQAGTGDA
jgi:hypothetical protein